MTLPDIFYNAPFMWFLLGLLFALLELAIPGFVLMFFALGAWLVALLGLVFDMELAVQIILFVLASSLSLVLLRKKLKSRFFREHDSKRSNQDNELLGQKVLVVEGISPSKRGKVEYKGANWAAKSDSHIEEGSSAEIIDQDSITLIVKPL